MTLNLPNQPSDLVGRRLKAARALRGWTMSDLADQCARDGAPEITLAVIANIESGRRDSAGRRRRRVTVDELMTLALALGIDPVVLMGGTAEDIRQME